MISGAKRKEKNYHHQEHDFCLGVQFLIKKEKLTTTRMMLMTMNDDASRHKIVKQRSAKRKPFTWRSMNGDVPLPLLCKGDMVSLVARPTD